MLARRAQRELPGRTEATEQPEQPGRREPRERTEVTERPEPRALRERTEQTERRDRLGRPVLDIPQRPQPHLRSGSGRRALLRRAAWHIRSAHGCEAARTRTAQITWKG